MAAVITDAGNHIRNQIDKLAVAAAHAVNVEDSSLLGILRTPLLENNTEILPMQWGNSSKHAFFQFWEREIKLRDPKVMVEEMTVYNYLERKLWMILDGVKKPGQPGWAFKMAKGTLELQRCVVWADGTKSGQTTPLGTPSTHQCQWWPCIIMATTEMVPFFCPALAWSNARPWDVHASRLRKVAENPIISPPAINPFHTSSVTIEEVETDDDEEWVTL